MPRRNRNATRGRRHAPVCPGCGGRPDPYPEPGLEGLCGPCGDLAVWGASPLPLIPGDGYSDGGTPYSDDELTPL